MAKSFKTHCRIIDYLQVEDPDLTAILKHACIDNRLYPRSNQFGITFLVPKDKTLRKKIDDLAHSDKIEDANKLSDILSTLIIRENLKTIEDWKLKKILPNSLAIPQQTDITDASGGKITFKSGAVATIDPKFLDASRNKNISVWNLISGELPITTDHPAQPQKPPRSFPGRPGGPPSKSGSYDPGPLNQASLRFIICLAVENTYMVHQIQNKTTGGDTPIRDIYLETTMNLIHYILNDWSGDGTALLYDKVLPLIGFNKADFYFLIEPHRVSDDYLLPDSLISDWWSKHHNIKCNCREMITKICDMLTKGITAAIYTSRDNVFTQINNERTRLLTYTEGRPRGSIEEIAKCYDSLSSHNTLGTVTNFYPPGLAAYYSSNMGLKLLHDELRYLTFHTFRDLERYPVFDKAAFNGLVNNIGEALYAQTVDDRSRQHKLLNKASIKYLISPTEKIQEIKIFLCSTHFLFVPLTEHEAETMQVTNSTSRPNPDVPVVFNIAKDQYIEHRRIIFDTTPSLSDQPISQEQLITALKSLDPNGLDPALLTELERKFNGSYNPKEIPEAHEPARILDGTY